MHQIAFTAGSNA